MFGTLYEPPTLTFSGLFLLFAIQIVAMFVYKQAQAYYRNQALYQQYGGAQLKLSQNAAPVGPAGPATAAR